MTDVERPSGPPPASIVVDASHLACPLPVIELAKAIETISPGESLELIATDEAARTDVSVWCRMRRHQLHSVDQIDGAWHFVIERRH